MISGPLKEWVGIGSSTVGKWGESCENLQGFLKIFRPYAPVSMEMARPGVGGLDVPPFLIFWRLPEIRNKKCYVGK